MGTRSLQIRPDSKSSLGELQQHLGYAPKRLGYIQIKRVGSRFRDNITLETVVLY